MSSRDKPPNREHDPLEDFKRRLTRVLPEYGVVLAPESVARLCRYLGELVRWNRRVRLVGSADPTILVRRHVAESLFLARLLPLDAQTLIDVGSGAGFPGLALQLAYPRLNTTLVESNARKATFLNEICRHEGLGGVFTGRAGDYTQVADIVTARALEGMSKGPTWAARLLAERGVLACWITRETAIRWREQVREFTWDEPVTIPNTQERCIVLAHLARP